MRAHDIGSRVRHAREQRGLSLSDAARMTKLSPTILRAIERNDFERLPAGMYRKAYLRTFAAHVGLDPLEMANAYEDVYGEPRDPAPTAEATSDRWIGMLAPYRGRALATLAVLGVLCVTWFARQHNADSATRLSGIARSESVPPGPRSEEAAVTTAGPDSRKEGVAVARVVAPHDFPLKINLTTTGWCWIVAESDGERVVYGLIEPGRRLVVEGQRVIGMRFGDGGAVQLSINDGPPRSAGADGEVVELEVTSDDVAASSGLSE